MEVGTAAWGFAAAAALFGGAGGWCLSVAWARAREAALRRRRGRARAFPAGREGAPGMPQGRVLGYAAKTSRRLALGAAPSPLGRAGRRWAARWLGGRSRRAGVEGVVTPEGLAEASARLGCAAAAAGALAGALFSAELTLIGCVIGAAAGAASVPRAIGRAERRRAEALERSLSEMLETVSLGLRSGLSFDRSFQLYGEHFDVPFARECAAAQRSWSLGLATREDALRDLAASYGSPLLARVMEATARSLRFGSSLVEVLESAAADARAERRAHVEERVAKAPVKMMVPTGALILPAMLLLVLGPVLLELMEGF